jgi:outer membrane protein TolC
MTPLDSIGRAPAKTPWTVLPRADRPRRLGLSPRVFVALAVTLAGAGLPAAARAESRVAQGDDDDGGRERGLRLSLAQALEMAERQSPEIVLAELDAEIAGAQAGAVRRPWQVSLGVGTNRADKLGESLAPARSAGRPFLEATVGHRFSTGTSVEAKARGVSERGMENPWSSSQLSVTQQLLRGMRPTVVDSDRIAAEHAARASTYTARATVAQVRAGVATAYWELAFAHADLAIRKLSLEAARDQARMTELLARGGTVPRSAILAAEQAIAQRLEAVVVASQAIVERSLELRALTGLPIGPGDVVVVPTDRLARNTSTVDAANAVASALSSSPQLAAARAGVDAASAQRRATDDRVLPGLDLALVADSMQNHLDPVKAAMSMEPIAGESITATLTLRYDLFGGQGAERLRGRAAERKAKTELETARRRLQREALAATVKLDSAARRIELTRNVEDRAVAILKAETTRFSGGQVTVFDVLSRQQELEEARRAALRANIDHAVARAELERLIGGER